MLYRVRSWNNGMRCMSLYSLLLNFKMASIFCTFSEILTYFASYSLGLLFAIHISCCIFFSYSIFSGISLYMRPANERRRYIVTSSVIGWAHTENDLYILLNHRVSLEYSPAGIGVLPWRPTPWLMLDNWSLWVDLVSSGCSMHFECPLDGVYQGIPSWNGRVHSSVCDIILRYLVLMFFFSVQGSVIKAKPITLVRDQQLFFINLL